MAWRISTKFDLQVNLNWGYHTAPITEAKSTSNSPSTASPHPSALYSNINSHHRQTTAATTFKLNNQLQSTRLHPPNWFLTPSSSSSTASSFKAHPQLQHLTCSQHCSPSQQQLAETQQKQMKEANDFANQHAEQLRESQRQLQASKPLSKQLHNWLQHFKLCRHSLLLLLPQQLQRKTWAPAIWQQKCHHLDKKWRQILLSFCPMAIRSLGIWRGPDRVVCLFVV